METGFLNSHDGDRYLLSHLCDQSMLDESDALLSMMQEELNFVPIPNSHFIGTHSFWDHDSSNGADVVLPLPLVEDNPQPDIIKEDFQKMLSDWQEHLGTLQSSDSEEMDVLDFVGMDISMSKNSEGMPSDIFEDSCEMKRVLSVEKLHIPSKDRMFNGISLNLSENLNSFNLENFLEDDDEEEHKFGLIVAEEEDHQPQASVVGVSELKAQNTSICPQDSSSDVAVNVSVSNNKEPEEESVDVETVVDQIPVLEAGDLKSLLEQFEASEAFNSIVGTSKDESEKLLSHGSGEAPSPKSLPNIHAKKQVVATTSISSTVMVAVSKSTPASSSSGDANGTTLHETIRDSLPQEVIDRIKASNRRKAIPVIPAMPSRRPGRGATRMQVAAATLSRNKLLKLVSGGGKGGESIQLDHDYCSSSATPSADVAPPKSFYHSNASEYASEQAGPNGAASKDSKESSCAKPVLGENKVYSRLPEYYVVLAPQKALDKGRKGGLVKEEVWDKNSRKDSGLESGEVSDASEETVTSPVTAGSRDVVCSNIVKSDDRNCIKSIISSCNDSSVVTFDVQNKTELSDKKKTTSVMRGEGSPSVLKEWSTIRQDNGLTKPVAMVSVLKKNNLGCATNTPVRQQSLLISSNNNNKSCNVNSSSSSSSSNSTSTNTNTCSSSAIAKSKLEAEKVKTEGPKKKKLNLEEYRSRLKELDRSKTKEESTSTCSLSVSDSSATKPEEIPITKDDSVDESQSEVVGVPTPPSVSNEKTVRPLMHSVEVQTQSSIFDQVPQENEKSKEVRSRKKQRKYRSKRASSSSSSHSTSSNSSRRHRKSRSQMRRRTSRRRSHGGCSLSSSGSQRPRSRSNSSRSTSSYSAYSSRSRSRSCSRSRSRSRSSVHRAPSCSRPRPPYQPRYGYRRPLPYNSGWRSRSRSPPFGPRKNDWMLSEREKQRQVEERRVIYVGRIDEGTSKAELRRRFEPFGPIIDISVHFREHGDNYGFVTFAYKVDAYEAVEHGNDDPNLPRYDLCFGGRRAFCKTRYADLDGLATSDGPASGGYSRNSNFSRRTDTQAEDFDLLLREAQAKLRKRKV